MIPGVRRQTAPVMLHRPGGSVRADAIGGRDALPKGWRAGAVRPRRARVTPPGPDGPGSPRQALPSRPQDALDAVLLLVAERPVRPRRVVQPQPVRDDERRVNLPA